VACGSFSGNSGGAESTNQSEAGATDGNADAAGPDAGGAETGVVDAALADAAGPDAGTPPDGGSTRLLAFVTGIGYADVTTTASADAKCRAEADGRLPGKFVAWFSSSAEPAPMRLVNSKGVPVDGPWFRFDGARIAASRAALSNTNNIPLDNAIKLTATGKLMGGGVWTGTTALGATGNLCPLDSPTTGVADQVGAPWTEQTFFVATCGSTLLVYCFQVE
jgi:hypothetical protein